jgi:LmbE family N-acetylglucosaminyl deacetylase
MPTRVAFAIAAHPDDIEFMMAGTLILLREAGYQIHCMNLASGSCGTALHSRDEIVRIRRREARAAAKALGATYHPSLVDDLEVLYETRLLASLAAVVRKVAPSLLLVPAPEDYMEDHQIAARLAVTAAFCRGMRNFHTRPETKPVAGEVAIYHSLPFGLRDGMRRRVWAELYVNIGPVIAAKRQALASHESQKQWLDLSQGLDSYLAAMEQTCAEVGRMSGRFKYAEGWRRHSHLGFSAAEIDPLTLALGRLVHIDRSYQRSLEAPARAPSPRPTKRRQP